MKSFFGVDELMTALSQRALNALAGVEYGNSNMVLFYMVLHHDESKHFLRFRRGESMLKDIVGHFVEGKFKP